THTFVVHVNILGLSGTPTPADGATVAWEFDGPGVIDASETTCGNIGTINGDCNIVFTNDGTPGSLTLTITSVTLPARVEKLTADLTAAATGRPPITAEKTWVAYHVTVTPSATNPVNTQHNFTIHATRDNGTPPPVDVEGAQIAFDWT